MSLVMNRYKQASTKPPKWSRANEYGGLSERELEVAALIGQGKSNAEMAELLVVSRRTVETYVSRVLSKLGLTSRSQIALWTRDKKLDSRESKRGALSKYDTIGIEVRSGRN